MISLDHGMIKKVSEEGRNMLREQYENVACDYQIIDFLNNPTDEKASKYIEWMFQSRSKDILFNFKYQDAEILTERSVHSLSAYLLGLHLKEIVSKRIETELSEKAPLKIMSFQYPWWLCCLFHDVFTKFETVHNSFYAMELPEMIDELGIKHTIYSPALPEDLQISEWAETYQESTIEQYYMQRYKEELVDHGIFSGYYCFDRLTRNFLEAREFQTNSDSFVTENNGWTLQWNKNQIWIYHYVADAITAHNIWHKEKYKCAEIDPNNKNATKLSLERSPEPIQTFL